MSGSRAWLYVAVPIIGVGKSNAALRHLALVLIEVPGTGSVYGGMKLKDRVLSRELDQISPNAAKSPLDGTALRAEVVR